MTPVKRWSRRRAAATAVLALAGVSLLLGAQWWVFYREFAPRIQAANAAYFDLVTEKAEGRLYRRLESHVKSLQTLAAPNGAAGAIAAAWSEFNAGFSLAPHDVAKGLRAELQQQGRRLNGAGEAIEKLNTALDGLLAVYSDPYRDLLKDLEQPPLYLVPAALWARDQSHYLAAVTMNRALHLAQAGEFGTARVLLTRLQAAAEDPHLSGLVHYSLGRLDLEVVLDRPESELHRSAVEYLRRSLQADPEAALPQRVLAYLLSRRPRRHVLEMHEGTPSDASPGEGNAIEPDFRKF